MTFVFTDVEGSTKLLHELGEEEYAHALEEHRRLVRGACVGHGASRLTRKETRSLSPDDTCRFDDAVALALDGA